MVHEVRAVQDINAPRDVVWRWLTDHEGTPRWVDEAARVTVAVEGSPRNGLGAERVVEWRPRLWTTIHERITHFEPMVEWRYVLFRGMPGLRSHLGKLRLDDLPGGATRVRWEIDMEFRRLHPFALFVPSFMRQFRDVIERGLAKLKTQIEAEAG